MSPTNDNPLSPATIQQLRQDEAELSRIHAHIMRAISCGIDQRAEQALCEALARQAALLLDTYGGGRTSRTTSV